MINLKSDASFESSKIFWGGLCTMTYNLTFEMTPNRHVSSVCGSCGEEDRWFFKPCLNANLLNVKGLVHPEVKNLSLLQRSFSEQKLRNFGLNLRTL